MTSAAGRCGPSSPESPRRVALLDAGIAVLATAGLRGLTHRAVDRQAGFPEGTCSVSFRTRAALLSALTAHVGTQLADEVRAMGEELPTGTASPLESLPNAIVLLERWVTQDNGARMVAMLELFLESLRSSELVEAVGEWRGELVTIVETIVRRTQTTETRLRAETAVASLEGIVLSALALPVDARGEYIRSTLLRVFMGTAGDAPVTA